MGGLIGIIVLGGAIVVGMGALVFMKIRWSRAEARKWAAMRK